MDTFLANDVSKKVQARVEQFFSEDVEKLKSELASISDMIDPSEEPVNPEHLTRVHAALSESVDACRRLEEDLAGLGEADVLVSVQEAFRSETAPWFHQSWIAERAQTKPTGFPGDCVMLAALYDGKHLRKGLGGYIDTFIFQLPLATGVKFRMEAARDFLLKEIAWRQGDVRILDIASGPAREFVNWSAQPENGRVSLTCMDNDPAALQFVDQNVRGTATGLDEMRLVRYNALRTKSHSATERNFGKFDILYSVGLADYIPDEPLIAMLSGWRQSVNENGVVYVAFKDCREYDKTPYQWHLDWHFLQRTEEDCRALLVAAGFDASAIEMERDDSGIIIHFFCPVAAAQQLRVDAAEPAVKASAAQGSAVTNGVTHGSL